MKRGLLLALLAGIALLAALPALAGSFASGGSARLGDVEVVARGLNNPRQVWAVPSGAVYVAEAGTAGPRCLPAEGPEGDPTCIGTSGAIARVKGGTVTRVVRNLASIGGQDGSFTSGSDGVAVADGAVFVAIAGRPECQPVPVPPRILAQAGKLLRKSGAGPARAYADIERIECARNPDGTDRNSNPYAVFALGKTSAIVVDAGANALFRVDNGRARVLAVLRKLPSGAQPVPTSIARGPDGAYYVGEFGGEPPRGRKPTPSRVIRVDATTGKATVFQTGFAAITGVAFDQAGNLYVTQATINPANERELRGVVVRVAPDGRRTRLGLGKLFFPASGSVSADGRWLYVSNYSILPGKTPAASPFRGAGGQLVRIALTG